MKITLYTIKECAFSKQEKEYLNTNKLVFEEKDLETNKDFLTEMLAISNNFAGTPVTRVEKDDGTISVLKGFTKGEFDTTFGFVASPTTPNAAVPTDPAQVNDTPISPVAEVPPVPPAEVVALTPIETIPPAPVPTNVEPIEQTVTPDLSTEASAKVDPLKSVMDDLQTKSVEPTNQVITPTIVDPAAPIIPDFPAK